MIICIDFDGTVVDHRYPEIGEEAPHATEALKRLVLQGHKLILWTMRDGILLEVATEWFADRGIPLWGIQENPTQKHWTKSLKAYAQIYIDDAAFGCPLVQPEGFIRPCVDWLKVHSYFLIREGGGSKKDDNK